MKYICDWKSNDEEIFETLQKYDYDINIESVKNILYSVRHTAYSNSVVSWPSETENILKNEDLNRKCKVYRRYTDGDYCIYENIYCIELI